MGTGHRHLTCYNKNSNNNNNNNNNNSSSSSSSSRSGNRDERPVKHRMFYRMKIREQGSKVDGLWRIKKCLVQDIELHARRGENPS
ncbi:hypothetical protein PoB_002828900 [Plakobranchus ocellatus]|uniref:Uncharacterized protein n=1 Tax=Plakobranchus ocellatus TaxID=259542 RepID=A0AAV4A6C5_9GAST|nr:hypothetical protein PoB_002828900 [Plakobranchus ocellatus]